MSGGITQLVAVGIQDAYLSGNPEISFFRSSYKRYTHYAQNVERQIIQGTPTTNGVSLLRFEKKGDLLSDVYLTARDANNTSNVNVNWNQIISKMELMIGGQIIDTQDMTYTSNIDPVVNAKSFSHRLVPANINTSVFLPLKFFFCRDWQNALPLVALQYHDVEIRITWAQPNVWDQYIAWARFIYLDNDEREWFAKNKHDMLITQVVRVPITPVNNYEFALAQPVKYIAFESNNYTSVYNSGGNLGTTIPVISTAGIVPGMSVSLPQYLPSSNSYVTSVTNSTVTVSSQNTQTIPAGTALPFVAISNTFTLASSSSTTVTVTGTNALAALPTQIAFGWQVFISGTNANASNVEYTVNTVTLTNGVISGITLTASVSVSFSSTAQLTFIPPNSVFETVQSLNSLGPYVISAASGTTTALITVLAHGIPSSGSALANITGIAGATFTNPVSVSYVSATTLNFTVTGTASLGTNPTLTFVSGITMGAGVASVIPPAGGQTYIAVNTPAAVQTNMIGWNVILPQMSGSTYTSAVGVVTGIQNDPAVINGVIIPPSGTSLLTVQFPPSTTYSTSAVAASATLASATQLYMYPTFVYTEASVTGGSLNQGSFPASNMQFKMQINGNDIGDSREMPHWVDVNQYYLTPYGYYNDILIGTPQVAIVPFCLDTAKVQPTGALNFSRIDTFRLVCPTATNFQQLSKLGAGSYFYAVNYNVLRIQNGMGAVMYSS
jgi:hypothetical protein